MKAKGLEGHSHRIFVDHDIIYLPLQLDTLAEASHTALGLTVELVNFGIGILSRGAAVPRLQPQVRAKIHVRRTRHILVDKQAGKSLLLERQIEVVSGLNLSNLNVDPELGQGALNDNRRFFLAGFRNVEMQRSFEAGGCG